MNLVDAPAMLERVNGEAGDELNLLTVEDLERIFQVSERTARKFYQQYGLRSVPLPGGREVRFTRAAVREFIERCEKGN